MVDALESLGFDSLWLSERISGPAPDPLVAMAYGAGRTERLKFGMSVMVLPGRNPVVLAKELATLANMSGGRLLPAFGLGAVDPVEQQAFGVQRSERAKLFDEMLTVMRQCWTGEPFTHHGDRYDYDDIRVLPAATKMEVWLGGIAPSELRRIGRMADGWLPSFVTPADAAAGRGGDRGGVRRARPRDRARPLRRARAVLVRADPRPAARPAGEAAPRPGRPSELVPTSWEGLTDLIRRFIDVGTSKFVVLPLAEPDGADAWVEHLTEAAEVLLPLETR